MTDIDKTIKEMQRFLVPKHIPVGQHLKWLVKRDEKWLVKRDDKIEENRKKNDLHK